jgi:hypothetical protein
MAMPPDTLLDQAATPNEGDGSTGNQDGKPPEGDGKPPEGDGKSPEGDGKPPEGDGKPPAGAPETYELKPGEGEEFSPEFLTSYTEVARKLNLTNEQAQEMIDTMSPIIAQQQMARIETIRNEWTESAKVDKEFGGEKLSENLATAKQALDKWGTPELRQLIKDTGLGNHPEIIRFFYRAGKALSQDTFVGGHKEGKSAPKTFNEMASQLYKS